MSEKFTDSELVLICQAGETDRFAELFDRYSEPIYRFIFYKTHHRETAEDLLSQTFLRALEKIDQFNTKKGTFQAWLYQIARNLVIDHYRAFRTDSPIEDAWSVSDSVDIERDVEMISQFSEVRAALSELSGAQREIVLLRAWEGRSYAEIAEIVGKSEAACKMSFSRTTKSLKKEFAVFFLILFLSF